jgi:hypothetical protein
MVLRVEGMERSSPKAKEGWRVRRRSAPGRTQGIQLAPGHPGLEITNDALVGVTAGGDGVLFSKGAPREEKDSEGEADRETAGHGGHRDSGRAERSTHVAVSGFPMTTAVAAVLVDTREAGGLLNSSLCPSGRGPAKSQTDYGRDHPAVPTHPALLAEGHPKAALAFDRGREIVAAS